MAAKAQGLLIVWESQAMVASHAATTSHGQDDPVVVYDLCALEPDGTRPICNGDSAPNQQDVAEMGSSACYSG